MRRVPLFYNIKRYRGKRVGLRVRAGQPGISRNWEAPGIRTRRRSSSE